MILLSICNIYFSFAQDSINNSKDEYLKDTSKIQNINKSYTLNYKNMIIPAVFIGYGFTSLSNKGLQNINNSTTNEINEHQIKQTVLDNYTQYIPVVMVYGLNALGVHGKHNFRERTIIYASAELVSSALVTSIKRLVNEKRPDNSNSLSFPSGHTSTAFVSAHFMFREYKDSNFWLSISGYPLAIFTGTYRIINNRHWLGDVVSGAGFGMLSTEMAYWLFPKINKIVPGGKRELAMLMPYYQKGNYGLSFVKQF